MLLPIDKKFNLVHVFHKLEQSEEKVVPNGSFYWNLAYSEEKS